MSVGSVLTDLNDHQVSTAIDGIVAQKQDQHDALMRTGGVKSFVDGAKAFLLFQPDCNWNDMLSGAPFAISVLGAVFVASTLPDAQGVTILPPKGGFKALSTAAGGDMALQNCLVQISQQGRNAFNLSYEKMQSIDADSRDIITDVINITQMLDDQDSARLNLKNTCDSLLKKANKCSANAVIVANEYHDWLTATCEVHAACCQTTTDTKLKEESNTTHLAAKQVEVDAGKDAKEAAKSQVETMKGTMKMAEEQFKKASEEFPNGWTLIGQEIVSNLAGTLTSALNQAVPALIAHYSTTAKIEQGVNIFKEASGGLSGKPPADHSEVKAATQADPPNAPVLPKDYQDPAYAVIKTAYTYLTMLQSLLTADNGNPDWSSINPKNPADTKSGAGVIKLMLESSLSTLTATPATTAPSTSLKMILEQCAKVAEDIDKAAKLPIGQQRPANDSDQVKGWIKIVESDYVLATGLHQTSLQIPGPSTAPIVPNKPPSDSKPDGSGLRAQIIAAATTKLNATSTALTSAQEKYKASSDSYVKSINALGKLQAELNTLKLTAISLEHIVALLLKCIQLLIQLQTQINKLVAFFDSIKVIVTTVVENQVGPFLDQIGAASTASHVLGGFTFTEFTAKMLFQSILNVRCYFTLFQDLSNTYVQVHKDYLIRGLGMLDIVIAPSSSTNKDDLSMKQQALADFTGKALPGIKAYVDAQQNEVNNNLQSMAQSTANDIQKVPVNLPAKALTDANTKSKDDAVTTAKAGLENSNSYAEKPMTFPTE